MRVLPRIFWPTFRFRRQLWRSCRRFASVARVFAIVELLVFASVLVLAFSSKRLPLFDSLGRRGDVLLALILLGLFALLHSLTTRKLLTRLEHYFAPARYEERRIFFDLVRDMRNISSIDQLYQSVADQIRRSLEADNVSVFVREELGGDYIIRASASSSPAATKTVKETELEGPHRLSAQAFIVRRLAGLTSPLNIESTDIQTWSQALLSASPVLREARVRESETLKLIKARLLVQIRRGDQLVGMLSLGPRRGGFAYSAADREWLVSVAAQLALVIENARLTERLVAEERLRRELALAAEVQRRLLPGKPPEHVRFQLAGFCEPARGVGGDYYDFIAVDNQRVGVAIADVAGKGMPAALLMSTVQATLRSLTAANGALPADVPKLGQMVGKLNRLIFNSTSGENYVTFFYAHFDCATRYLTYVNAGHNPPLYLPAGNSSNFQQLSSGGLITGVFEDSKYEQETVEMQPGGLMFMYTDGLSEALSPNGEEFGEERIEEVLAGSKQLPVKEISDEVVRRVKRWCKNVPLHDDLTFVVMKVS
jgi:sigma-B regulation protein RsbU (phosphoserine phosphatase)